MHSRIQHIIFCDVTFDKETPLHENGYLKPGYSFLGWATNDAMNHIAGILCKNAAVTEEDVPGYLAERCRETPKIVRELHFSLTEVLEEAAKSDKLSLLAFDYEAIGKLLSEAYAEEAREEEADPKTAAKIRRAAAVLGLNASAVSVFGRRRLTVVPEKIATAIR